MMKKKFSSEKGITSADIIVAVILITIFITILIVASDTLRKDSQTIEREAEAMYYAINAIEMAKGQDFSVLPAKGTNKIQNVPELQDGYIKDKDGNTTPYYQTITVEDYTELGQNFDKEPEILKKITVTIAYQQNDQEKNVTLSTIRTKEE